MNAFEQFLMADSPQSGVSAEVLEMLGRKAAMKFLGEQVPLTQAVSDLVSEHPELGNEHIKRVVEFANNVAFQELFSKSEDKNVHFDVADPGEVIRDLKDGGSPAHDGKTLDRSKDYSGPPTMEKDQFADPESGMQHLQNMSGQDGRMGQGEPIAKVASIREKLAGTTKKTRTKEKDSCGDLDKMADWRLAGLEDDFVAQFLKEASPAAFEQLNQHEHANPIENVYDLRVKLAAARTELARAHETFDFLIKEAREELYRTLKQEVMDSNGAGINGVLHALSKVANQTQLEQVLPEMAARLVTENVPTDRLQITKVASQVEVVNYDHPIIKTWSGLVKAAEEGAKTMVALGEIDRGLAQVNAFLEQATR